MRRTKGAYNWCYFFFNFLVASCVNPTRPNAPSSNHDGRGTCRPGSISTAVRSRALELWGSPLVRQCCGDAMAPSASLALNFMSSNSKILAEHLKRGSEWPVHLSSVVTACLTELSAGGMASTYSLKVLEAFKKLIKTVDLRERNVLCISALNSSAFAEFTFSGATRSPTTRQFWTESTL